MTKLYKWNSLLISSYNFLSYNLRKSIMDSTCCSKCGASRLREVADMAVRPPCPHCGETGLIHRVGIVETASTSDSLTAELIPGNQVRDWKQRWKHIQDEIKTILSPHTETMSSESIHAAQQRLLSFFIQTYHLKDALKDAAVGLRLKPKDVEDAVTNDPRLSLLADLANLDKHMNLTQPPRSGIVPIIGQVSGKDCLTGAGWELSMQIQHGTTTFNGLRVAEDAINAWHTKLKAWKLI